jgi:hypothetical protein
MSVPLSGYRDYAALAAYADDCAERAFLAAVQESYRRLAKSYRALGTTARQDGVEPNDGHRGNTALALVSETTQGRRPLIHRSEGRHPTRNKYSSRHWACCGASFCGGDS